MRCIGSVCLVLAISTAAQALGMPAGGRFVFGAVADSVPATANSSVALDSVRKAIPLPSFTGRWEQVGVKYTTVQNLEVSLDANMPQLTAPYLGAPSLDFWNLLSPPRVGFYSRFYQPFNPSGWALPADGLPLELRNYLHVPVPTVLLEGTNGTASGQQFGLHAGLPLSRRTELAGHFVRTNAKGPYERQSVLSDDFLLRVVRRDSVGPGSWLAAVQRLSWKGFENGGVVDPAEVVGVGYGLRNRALVDTRWALASSNRVSTQALVQRRWMNGSLGYRWERNRRAFKPDALGLDTAWGVQHRLEYLGWERLSVGIQSTQFRPDSAALSTAHWQRWTASVGWQTLRARPWLASGRLAWDARWGWMPQAEAVFNQRVRPARSATETEGVVELSASSVSVSSFRLRAQRMEVPWVWQSDWVGAAPWQAEAHWLPLVPWVRADRVSAWSITARGWQGLRVPTSSGYLGIRSFTEPTSAWTVQSTVDLATGSATDAASSRWRSSLRITGALSSDAYAMPVPLFAYVGTVARKWNLVDRGVRIEAELGAVGNSPYYAPAYDPRWGAEVTQVGWLPAERQRIQQWVLPFLQLQVRWKTASAFVVLNQFNQGWGPWAAFASPYVPVANAHLRLGARWFLFN